jgi:CRISPR system Cascade subunit CasB
VEKNQNKKPGTLVQEKINSLCNGEVLRDASDVRRILAELRRGLGKEIGECGFSFVLENLDEEDIKNDGVNNDIDDVISVAYSILTLFAKHQQGNSKLMHKEKQSIGSAMKIYKSKFSDDAAKSFKRRFEILITSSDRDELLQHLRQLISLLKDFPLDYVALANDVYKFKYSESRDKIRLRWGKDFYSNSKTKGEKENEQ